MPPEGLHSIAISSAELPPGCQPDCHLSAILAATWLPHLSCDLELRVS